MINTFSKNSFQILQISLKDSKWRNGAGLLSKGYNPSIFVIAKSLKIFFIRISLKGGDGVEWSVMVRRRAFWGIYSLEIICRCLPCDLLQIGFGLLWESSTVPSMLFLHHVSSTSTNDVTKTLHFIWWQKERPKMLRIKLG